MDQQQQNGQIRIFVTGLAAFLAGKGYFFDADTWNVILGAVFTIGMSIWSAKALTRSSQKVSVAGMANTLVLTTTPQSSDAAVATKVAAMPEVTEVLATQHVANNTVSDKVVATPTI